MKKIISFFLASLLLLTSIGTLFAFAKNATSFSDVNHKDYYYDAVIWAVANEITTGTSDTTFSPYDSCTRAQMVTFLYRKVGEPEITSKSNPFVDVNEKDYFYNAVLWAVEKGITKGTDNSHFSPEDTVTRGQAIEFLYRVYGVVYTPTNENVFVDVRETDYYYTAVLWALNRGITNGISNNEFGPDDNCIRAQIVTILYRYEKTKQIIKIAVVGDSLSDFYKADDITGKMSDSYVGHVYPAEEVKFAKYMWYNVLAKKLNSLQETYRYEVTAVDAISGSMVCAEVEGLYGYTGSGFQMWSSSRIEKLSKGGEPDIIFVEGGSNDYLHQGDNVYTVGGQQAALDSNIFKENYDHYMDLLTDRYPNSRIVCLSIYGFGVNNDDAFIKAVQDTATKYELDFVNMKECINASNWFQMTISDHAHMNILGQKTYALKIFESLFTY